MERNRRWVVTPRRLIISAVLSIAAIFVTFAAWGLHNWSILAVGLAAFAGAVALAVISGMTSKIRGVAHVLEVNAPPAARYRGRVTATAIIRYKARRDSVRVLLREDDVPLNKWPAVHDELPVVGLSNDLWSAEVLWSQVPTHKRVAARRRRAEARATAAATASAAGARSDGGAGGGIATATAERADADTAEYVEVPEFPDEPVGGDEATETVGADPGKRDNWSPPGSGKVVDGIWWESPSAPADARLKADITTPDEPRTPRRAPGSKPSPKPRRSPDDVIVGVDFGSSDPTQTQPTEPLFDAETSAPQEPEMAAPPADPVVPEPRMPASDDLDGTADAFVPRQPTGPRHAAPDEGEEDLFSALGGRSADASDDSDASMMDAPSTAAQGSDTTTADQESSDPPRADDSLLVDAVGESEDGMFGSATSSLRTSPLQVTRAGVLPATVPAPRSDDDPYDHSYDAEAVAEAYRDALPPPGVDRPGRADVTVQLFVSNLSRAIIFYRDILGFTEIDAGRASAVLDLRDVRVILKVVDDMLPSTKNVQFSLEVDDLEVAYEDLRARGVRFVHRPRRVEHYEQLEHFAAPFEDPDGYRISLSSWRSVYQAD